MSRAIRTYRRKDGKLTATFNLDAIQRKLEKGGLSTEDRRIYEHVFGAQPEVLHAPPPPVMIEQIFFFLNGAIACTDSNGQQVPRWQTNLLCDHLRKMLRAGVITGSTKIAADGREGVVGDWIAAGEVEQEKRG